MTAPAAVSTGMRPTSSPPTVPEPLGKRRLTASRPRLARSSGQAEPRQQLGYVTDRDPNCDHEPPYCRISVAGRSVDSIGQIWMICVLGLTPTSDQGPWFKS